MVRDIGRIIYVWKNRDFVKVKLMGKYRVVLLLVLSSVCILSSAVSRSETLSQGNLAKCLECVSTIKRRIAVMPVKTGVLSAEAGIASTDLSSRIVDKVEAALRNKDGVLVVNRQELGELIAEMKLANSNLANKELAQKPGKVIPAELLLHIAIDRLDMSTSRKRNEDSTARDFFNQASQLEMSAEMDEKAVLEAKSDLRERQRSSDDYDESNSSLYDINSGDSRTQSMAAGLAAINGALDSVNEDHISELEDEIRERSYEAARKRQEAQSLRRRAEDEASKQITEDIRYHGTLVMAWKAVDAHTGAVVSADNETLSDDITDTLRVSSQLGSSVVEQSEQKANILVSNLLDQAVLAIATGVDNGIDKVPFNAQVVSIDKKGIILNAGENFGLTPGDAFEILRKGRVLTDPSTGEVLLDESTTVGKAVVVSVQAKTAVAKVFERSANISRGDIMKWIGVYK